MRPVRQAGRSRWRILIVVVVVAVLGSLTADGVVYARRPHDRGATPLYIGAQPARDPGSVIIGAAGDIACPPGRRRSRPNACGMEGTAKVLKAIRPDAVLTLGDHQYPSGSLADFEASTPMNADGEADAKGVMQFVAGAGGRSHYKFRNPKPTSKVRITGRDGVLRLQLTRQAYAWEFTAAPRAEVLDSGTGQCH